MKQRHLFIVAADPAAEKAQAREHSPSSSEEVAQWAQFVSGVSLIVLVSRSCCSSAVVIQGCLTASHFFLGFTVIFKMEYVQLLLLWKIKSNQQSLY